MSFEIAICVAKLLDRTLVLPPAYDVHRAGLTALDDYFDFEDFNYFVPTIRWSEFVKIYPNNLHENKIEGIERIAYVLEDWAWDKIWLFRNYDPVAPNSEEGKRIRQFANGRGINTFEQIASFNNKHRIIYVPQRKIFGIFHTIFYLPDVQTERWLKESMKAYVHYQPIIFHQAARIIASLSNNYGAYHIRITDFRQAYSWEVISGVNMISNTKEILSTFNVNNTLYIASDESNKESFKTEYIIKFEELGYNVITFNDVKHLIPDAKPYHYGIIEAIVCAYAKAFIGTKLSTFTAFIWRLRFFMRNELGCFFTTVKFPTGYSHTVPVPNWSGEWSGAIWGRDYPSVLYDWNATFTGDNIWWK